MKNILASDFSAQLQNWVQKNSNDSAADLSFLNQEAILKVLESPKDSSLGDLAYPCFTLSRLLKKGPPQIAQELTKSVTLPLGFSKVNAVGGYLNFFFDLAFWSKIVLEEIQKAGGQVGDDPSVGKNKSIVVDYSSPNVAKPMSIGHLRSTVIGQSLVNIFKAMGFKTVGINYLGDWGVQFGKLAWAHLNKAELLKRAESKRGQIQFDSGKWHELLTDIKSKPDDSFDYLYALYVVFHAVAEVDPELDQFGRDYFLKLEKRKSGAEAKDGTVAKIEQAWQKFIEVSLVEYNRVYALLGTKHDLVRGESFHEPDLPGVVKKLKDLGLLKVSEGAQIVDLSAYDMPPCLITKTDGATLYATRDIAAAFYRHDQLKGDRLIYVVGAEQSLHFKQLFKVLLLMGCSWAKDCQHIPFGLYRFKEGKMSTRRGNVVFLEDVLDRAIDLVRKIIQEKNPDLTNAEGVSRAVGTGAVIFHDLMNDRQKNIDFDWDRLLDFNGDTGPYVQYTHVRCCSIMNKWGKSVPHDADLALLDKKLEVELLRVLGKFNDIVLVAYEQLKPNWIAQYLLELSKAFSAFYYEHRILEGDMALQQARVTLVDSTRIVLKKGLELLGLQTPEAM